MKYGFNLKNKDFIKNIKSNEMYVFNLVRNMALLTGEGAVVRYFYQNVASRLSAGKIGNYVMQEISQSFLARASIDNPFVFYGITRMINKGIARLVTSGGVDFKGFHEERLAAIYDDNDFQRKLTEAVSKESGLGDVLFRVVIDKTITANHPIIEVISPETYELIIRRGLIVGYVLKVRKTIEKVDYERQDIYRFNLEGVPVIEYKVIDENGEQIDLSKRTNLIVKIINELGLDIIVQEVKTFPVHELVGLKRLPVIYKTNTEVNDGLRGIADTEGMHSIESALTEVLSNMVDETRKAGLKILIDQRLVPTDIHGNPMKFDEFKSSYIVTRQEGLEGDKLIQTAQGLVTTDKYIEASKYLIAIACNKAEIHPLTVGVTGLESIIASAESQQEREGKTSLRKRELKIREWTPKLQELSCVLLEMDDFMKGDFVGDYKTDEIEAVFGEYTNPTIENIIDIISKKVDAGLISMKESIKELRPDIEEAALDLVYAQVKAEKGLALTPYEMSLLSVSDNE